MNGKENSLGIDIGFRNVKFVELYRENAEIYLKDFAIAPTNFTGEEMEGERVLRVKHILSTAIKDKKFSVQNIFLTISDPLIFTRFIKVPITDTKKISQMISFEALQQIPFPLEEVIWDYQIIRTDIGEAEALLVAVKTEIIYNLLTQVSLTLANAEVVDIGPLSLGGMLYQSENVPAMEDCHAVLSFGAKSSYVVILNKDIFWLRILPIGGDNVTNAIQKAFDIDFETAEEYKHKGMLSVELPKGAESDFNRRLNDQIGSLYTKIIFEFKRSLNFFRTQHPGRKISSVSLTGGGSKILGLEGFALKNFADMNLKALNPFHSIMISDLVDKVQLTDSTHLLGEAVGAALRGFEKARLGVNIMPGEIISNKMRKKNFKYYVATAAFIIMVFLSKFYYDSKVAGIYKINVEEYNQQLEQIDVLSRDFKKQKAKVDLIEEDMNMLYGLHKSRTFWLEFISEIEKLKNEEIWITAFKNASSLKTGSEPDTGIDRVSADVKASPFSEDLLPFLVISGETSSEYEAISEFEKGLRQIPAVEKNSVTILFAKSPIDGIRAFAIGMKLKYE
ncbi:MAG: pilus assembly protein PilM [Candidatus Aureabacteria bacterium]|nr:pilus assembly protein PilM [Candidatus Auribacterota bacterium]